MEKIKIKLPCKLKYTDHHYMVEVDAEFAFEMFGLKFFVHVEEARNRNGSTRNEYYDVSEQETGCRVPIDNTESKEEAIALARFVLEKHGEHSTKKSIANMKKYIKTHINEKNNTIG